MSHLIVEVCRVDEITKHPNADAMELVHVKGWQVCTRLGQFKPGDSCVYFPPDSILPKSLADRLGVTKYLSPVRNAFENSAEEGLRVRVARLRGIASYGLIMEVVDNPQWEIGTDVAAFYGIAKWEPPIEAHDGDAARELAVFHAYSNIENFRNFPLLFEVGEEVVFTEKIHGMNSRVGLVQTAEGPQWVAGSHGVRRYEFDASGRRSKFWEPLTEPMKALLLHLAGTDKNVVVFGEVYGSGVQDMTYGLGNGKRSFRAFDIAVNGTYLDQDEKTGLLAQFGIEQVPVLYRGPFSREMVEAYCTGPTTICSVEKAGKHSFREGIVIIPAKERYCEARGGSGRLILKAINPDYLTRKGGTEFH